MMQHHMEKIGTRYNSGRALILVGSILAAVLAALTLGRVAGAFPEPQVATSSWQLDVTTQTPDVIAVPVSDGRVQWYWYLPYKVVNNTGADRLFLPRVAVLMDNGQLIGVNPATAATVFRAIQDRVNNPLLESPGAVIGSILQGPDYAKESVVIWKAPPEDVDGFTVFISGLSGENQQVTHPVTGESILLTKTLQLDYIAPGSPPNPQNQEVQLKSTKWVMR